MEQLWVSVAVQSLQVIEPRFLNLLASGSHLQRLRGNTSPGCGDVLMWMKNSWQSVQGAEGCG